LSVVAEIEMIRTTHILIALSLYGRLSQTQECEPPCGNGFVEWALDYTSAHCGVKRQEIEASAQNIVSSTQGVPTPGLSDTSARATSKTRAAQPTSRKPGSDHLEPNNRSQR